MDVLLDRLRNRWVLAALCLITAAALVVVGVRWWRAAHTSQLSRAIALVPPITQRYSWTDWAAVRARLHAHVDGSSSADAVQTFLDRAYDADLSSSSTISDYAGYTQAHLGFSPANIDWELLGQSTQGAVVVLGASHVDFDRVRADLRRAGFAHTAGDVWDSSPLSTEVAAELGDVLGHIVLDERHHRIYGSDGASYLRSVVRGGDGAHPSTRAVAAALGRPLTAEVYGAAYVCSHLAMSQADPTDQAQAAELIREAGGVDPMTGFAMGEVPGGVRVAMRFEDHGGAKRNAQARAKLASGPAPGQGGTFPDRFRLGTVQADGDLVTLDLHPVPGASVMSDLSTGPVLFASC